jgi:predicted enzyme related to lactoylglutathione lyase
MWNNGGPERVHMLGAMTGNGELRQVLHPVGDVEAAVDFYAAAFGFGSKFIDGDRYAALDAGATTLALAGPAEDVTDGDSAAGVKVADVEAAVLAVLAAGGTVVRQPEVGPHEVRAVIRDPWGNPVVVYAPA